MVSNKLNFVSESTGNNLVLSPSSSEPGCVHDTGWQWLSESLEIVRQFSCVSNSFKV